jgi:Papain-like cysteine protease AvrRpt2/Putative peptidoglycan binding domain
VRVLQLDANGIEVMFLQRLLNKHGADPYVREDADFGPRTMTALRAFQRANSIGAAERDRVGAATWRALGAVTEIRHTIRGFAQPTDTSCWSAAATMMLGTNQSVGNGRARLTARGEMNNRVEDIDAFVRAQGWHLLNSCSAPPASLLMSAMHRGPAWVGFIGSHFGHAVVFAGMLSDDATDGTGTVFIVNDPWPPGGGSGSRYGTTYLGQQVWLRSRTLPRPLPAMVGYVAQ